MIALLTPPQTCPSHYHTHLVLRSTRWEEQELEEEFITSGNWKGKHNALSRGAGADPPEASRGALDACLLSDSEPLQRFTAPRHMPWSLGRVVVTTTYSFIRLERYPPTNFNVCGFLQSMWELANKSRMARELGRGRINQRSTNAWHFSVLFPNFARKAPPFRLI